MRLDNLLDVFERDVLVPNAFGVNHDGGAVLAQVEAAGFVRTDLCFQAALVQFFFEF